MNTKLERREYKVGTKVQYPWISSEVVIFKRVSPFRWIQLEIQPTTIEEAQEYIDNIDMLEVA